MAVFFDATTEYLKQVGGAFPDLSSDHTVALWYRPVSTTPSGGAARTIFRLTSTPGSGTGDSLWIGSETDGNGLVWEYTNGGSSVGNATPYLLSLDVWVHVALVRTGTSYACYLNGVLQETVPGALTLDPVMAAYAGGDWAATWSSLSITCVRRWQRALTATQILREMQTTAAAEVRQLLQDTPLLVHTNLADLTNYENHWTAVGTLSTSVGPHITPGKGSVTLTGLAPTVVAQGMVGRGSMTITGRAPTLVFAQPQRQPFRASLGLTGRVPYIARTDFRRGVTSEEVVEFRQTTGLPAGTPHTVMFWTNGGGANVQVGPAIPSDENSWFANPMYALSFYTANRDAIDNTDYAIPQTADVQWLHTAVTQDGASAIRCYVTTADRTTWDVGLASYVDYAMPEHGPGVVDVTLGWNTSIKHIRMWTAVLSTDEIRAERDSETAVRTADLYFDTPWTSVTDIADVSGNGHDWTFVQGSAADLRAYTPYNSIDPARVTALTTIPDTFTQPATGENQDWTQWYSYTAQASDPPILGFYAYSSSTTIYPYVTVFSGPTDDLYPWPVTSAEFASGGTALYQEFARALEIPIQAGVTYYVKLDTVHLNGLSSYTIDADFQVKVSWPNNSASTVPVGTILITDDTDSFPLAFLSDTTGEIVRFVPETRSADLGCSLPNGYLGLQNGMHMPYPMFVAVYNPSLQLTQAGPMVDDSLRQISHNGTDTFYIASTSQYYNGYNVISRLKTDGTFTHADWVIPHLASLGGDGYIEGLAPSWDETVLYYHQGWGEGHVRRWDLVNNVQLTPLAIAPGNSNFGQDMMVLSDQTVIVARNSVDATGYNFQYSAYRYDPSGTLLNTYTFIGEVVNRMCAAPDEPLSFWVWSFSRTVSLTTSIFRRIRVSDGAVLNLVTSIDFQAGAGPDYRQFYSGDPSASPVFGHSNSCSLIVLRQPYAPGETDSGTQTGGGGIVIDGGSGSGTGSMTATRPAGCIIFETCPMGTLEDECPPADCISFCLAVEQERYD